MAEKRMISKKITTHDNFTSLPATTQALYLHLMMDADDDGFCDSTNMAISNAHAKKKDLDTLVRLHYIIKFDSGVYAIKHWQMQNSIRRDRYTPTEYQEEFSQLTVKPNGAYAMPGRQPNGNRHGCNMATNEQPTGCQSGNQTATNGQPLGDNPQPQYLGLGLDIGLVNNEVEEDAHAQDDQPVNDLGRVMTFFLDRINPAPSGMCVEMLKSYTANLGADVVLHAFGIAIDEHKTGWSYIKAILSRYEREGLRTLEAVLQSEQRHDAGKEPQETPPKPKKQERPVDIDRDLVEYPEGSGFYRPYWEVPGYDGGN